MGGTGVKPPEGLSTKMDNPGESSYPPIPMNLILLDSNDPHQLWKAEDPRGIHVRKVLGMKPGDSFFVGVENGRIGKATILRDGQSGMELETILDTDSPPPLPLHLLVGLPRPQVARRLLREFPSLGVENATFFVADKSEASYATSSLWTGEEWKRLLREGAEQAFCTWIPRIHHTGSLEEALAGLEGGRKVALDLYEATGKFGKGAPAETIALGPEGGWTNREREVLRNSGLELQSMGPRVMRVETALIAAVAIWSAVV